MVTGLRKGKNRPSMTTGVRTKEINRPSMTVDNYDFHSKILHNFVNSIHLKYIQTKQIRFRSKFLQKPLDISTSNFYRVIVRSKLQKSVLFIFCISKYCI